MKLQKGKLYKTVWVNPNGSGKNDVHFRLKGDKQLFNPQWLPPGTIIMCIDSKKRYSNLGGGSYRDWIFLHGDKIIIWCKTNSDANDHSFLPKVFELVQ